MTQITVSDRMTDLAALQVGLEPSYPTILFGVIVTFIWGIVWSGFIRDDEQQPLPSSFAAKMFFALSLCMMYIALVIAGFLAPDIVKSLQFPGLDDIPESFLRQIPLFAVIVMGALYSIPQIKEVGERYAILLHSAQYRQNDEIVLQRHLQSCAFNPSDDEVSDNIDYIRQFDVYITDRDHTSLKLDTVGAWRKVSSLLRLLKDECRSSNTVLNAAEREEVARLDEAHRRKTQLAMNIVRMVEHLDANATVEQKLTRIAAQLGDVSHRDREHVVSAEEIAREILVHLDMQSSSQDVQRPLRLSMKQMNQYLSMIERYFMTEYQIILEDVAKLMAKVIIRAGDSADERLDYVKKAGFTGLGHIQRVSFDNVIWVLLTTFAVAFGGLTLLFSLMHRPVNTSLVSSIALTISVSSLIGAMWGSRRSLVERHSTPWSSYLTAGFIAVAGFCLIHSSRFLLSGQEMLKWQARRYGAQVDKYVELKLITPEQAQYYARDSVLNWDLHDYLWQILPWSLTVLFLAVGICWLARMPHWPWSKDVPIYERLSDGAAMGLIYVAGGFASTLAHIGLKTGSGLSSLLKIQGGEGGAASVFFSSFRLMSFLIGFAIGAIIVREVRRIAHTQLIKPGDGAAGTAMEPPDDIAGGVRVMPQGRSAMVVGSKSLPGAG